MKRIEYDWSQDIIPLSITGFGGFYPILEETASVEEKLAHERYICSKINEIFSLRVPERP